jgi:hypothetical protein
MKTNTKKSPFMVIYTKESFIGLSLISTLVLCGSEKSDRIVLKNQILQSERFLARHGIFIKRSGVFRKRFNPQPSIDSQTPKDVVAHIMYWSKKLQVPVDEIRIQRSADETIATSSTYRNIFLANRSCIELNMNRYEKETRNRQAMTIIHELGHLTLEHHWQFIRSYWWLNKKQNADLRIIQEREADLYFTLKDKEVFTHIEKAVSEKCQNKAERDMPHVSYNELSTWLGKIKNAYWNVSYKQSDK